MKIDSYHHRWLFWPVSQIDIQRIMHGFLVDGHILCFLPKGLTCIVWYCSNLGPTGHISDPCYYCYTQRVQYSTKLPILFILLPYMEFYLIRHCVCVCVCLQLFGGFLIALSSLPEWLQWIKYLSLFRYSLEVWTDLDCSYNMQYSCTITNWNLNQFYNCSPVTIPYTVGYEHQWDQRYVFLS